ncbi:hypothetical protein F5Y15DRAFT_402454 [Xylariaceae sp. FL0016]|nr:hypothetical protein F5Y15DRAFT_402454 [Xylariaceae sp. FL0016]
MASAVEGSPFTPEQLQYWTAHASDTRVPNIIACVVITGFFSTLFVLARITGRRMLNGSLQLHISDWMVIVAWVFFVPCIVFFAMLTPYGGGRHVIYITNSYMLQVFSILSEGTYGLAMGFLKFSILSLYGSIFPSRTFHRYLWGLVVFITGWMLTSSLGAFIQCVPVAKAYDDSLDGYCIHYGKLSLVVGICNVITDFIIVAMPFPLVLKLNTSSEKKRIILITFAAGSSAVVASIVRLVYSLDVGSIDGSWTAIPAGYLSGVELTVGFLVVSIPVYRKVYLKIYKGEPSGLSGWSYQSGDTPLRYRKTFPSSNKSSDRQAKNGFKGSVLSNTRGGGSKHDSLRGSQDNVHPGHTIMVTANDSLEGNIPQTAQWGINVTDDIDLETLSNMNGTWTKVAEDETMTTPQRVV